MAWGEVTPPNPLPPDVSRFWQLAVVVGIGFSTALILVCARLFTRIYLLRVADWSDAILGFAMGLDVVSSALYLAAGKYGAGRHVYYLTPEQLAHAAMLGTAGVPFGQISMTLPKIAAAMVLLRIAGPSATKRIRYYFYAILAILTLLSVLYSIFLFVQCDPPYALWTDVPGAKCWDPQVIAYFGLANSIWSAFVDVHLAVYPIIIMRNLQMETRKKVSICILMGLGISATICAAFKIPHLQDQANPDITWAVTPLSCWSSAEVSLVMIAASVPLLRPLWLWALGKPYRGTTGRTGSSNYRKRTSRRGFVSFGSKKDTRNEMTIDVAYEETTTPKNGQIRNLLMPPPKDFEMNTFGSTTANHDQHGTSHGGIRVDKSIVITHEEV